jgi:hypothetical protein
VRQHAAAVAVGEAFLGHIDQHEVAGKGAQHQFDLGGRHGVDQCHELGAALLVFLLMQFGKAAAQGFDRLENILAGELEQHLPEQGAQQLDLPAQIIIHQQLLRRIHRR